MPTVASLQGLHAFMIHQPATDIERIRRLRRPDGKPRIHKILLHGENPDWLNQMPLDTVWVVRNVDISETRITAENAQRLGREHAEVHYRTMLNFERKGVSRDRLIFEGRNEPQPDEFPYVAMYEIARIRRAAELCIGLMLLVCNFGVGQPSTFDWNPKAGVNWTQFDALDREMQTSKIKCYLGLHAYFSLEGPNALFPASDHDMRWPQEGGRHLQCPWQDVKIILSEAGIDNGVNGAAYQKQGWHYLPGDFAQKARTYLDYIKWAERQYLADGRVVAVTLFTDDYENNEWDKFDIGQQDFWRIYEQYIVSGVDFDLWGDQRTARWQPLIEYRAREAELDPRLVGTLVAMESGGVVDAISPAGAVGLMQVMSRETGITSRPSRVELLNPDQNIKWGVKILKDHLTYYQGDLVKALAAYNWGMGNVDRYGPNHPTAKFYLDIFRKTWGELWPGIACPLGGTATPPAQPNPVPPDVQLALLADAEREQAIQLNDEAALQKAIATDGFWVTGNEKIVTINGVTYVRQRAEHPQTGEVRVYFCVVPDYGTVYHYTRPAVGSPA